MIGTAVRGKFWLLCWDNHGFRPSTCAVDDLWLWCPPKSPFQPFSSQFQGFEPRVMQGNA